MKKVLTATCALLMVAAIATADNHGMMPPGGGPGPNANGGLVVTSNGTVIVTDTVIDTGTRTATTTVKAIGSDGTVLWTATLTNGHGPLVPSGSNLLSVNETVASDGTATSTITAISLATGTTAWTKTFNGRVTDLRPFSGGTYVVVVVPATTSGGAATRSLVALSDSGLPLWSINL
jgi:hypothetical protein